VYTILYMHTWCAHGSWRSAGVGHGVLYACTEPDSRVQRPQSPRPQEVAGEPQSATSGHAKPSSHDAHEKRGAGREAEVSKGQTGIGEWRGREGGAQLILCASGYDSARGEGGVHCRERHA